MKTTAFQNRGAWVTGDHGTPRCGRSQQGQATTEFAVLALALVPLFIAVPLIGKYLDLIQTTEAASRYVAFEATVHNTSNAWKSDAELAAEVRRRFFSNSDSPVKTGDTPGDFDANRNPVWVDHAGHPFLEKFETAIGVSGKAQGLNAIAATSPYRGALDLSDDNLYTGSVTVKVGDIPRFPPFDAIGLSLTRKTVLLADPWTGRTPAAIRARIEGATVAYPIARVSAIIDVMGLLPTLVFDPAMKVGDFDWDIVPCDRLAKGC